MGKFVRGFMKVVPRCFHCYYWILSCSVWPYTCGRTKVDGAIARRCGVPEGEGQSILGTHTERKKERNSSCCPLSFGNGRRFSFYHVQEVAVVVGK